MSDGNPNTLFFTDGIPDGEGRDGFGSITAVPESFSTWAMMLAGFGGPRLRCWLR